MGSKIHIQEMEFSVDTRWNIGTKYLVQFTLAGNLEVWNLARGILLWESDTCHRGGAKLVMQSDGNLVIYDRVGLPVWSSGTHGHDGAHLAVQDDGNVVIYSPDSHALWDTGTAEASQAFNSLRD
jgi:hypothetical protein